MSIIEKLAPYVKSKLRENTNNSQKKLKSTYKNFSRGFLDKYEFYKLKKTIKWSYKNSPYYHKIFKENNLRPNDIKSFSDMIKIPITSSEDLQKDPKSFFCVPEKEFITVFTSSGMTGKPKKAYFTRSDVDKVALAAATGAKLLYGISNDDVIRLTFQVGYGAEIWGTRYCLNRAYGDVIGALIVATDRLPINEELEILNDFKPNIFGDVPSRINYLTKEMSKIVEIKSLEIEKFLVGAEPIPTPMRKKIEKSWNSNVFMGYGINELGLLMAGECEYKNGMHLSETSFLTEVIDPDTGEHLEDGEIGELIYTSYDRNGMPLIRYNSNDLGRIIPDMCSCGLPMKRIEIKGRTDDLILIGSGDNLYARKLDEMIFSIPEIIEYQTIIDKKNGKDLITIIAESQIINDKIRRKISNVLISDPKIKDGIASSKTISKPIIKLVKPDTFDRSSLKFKRLIDNRNLYE
jgi:phenylacetate-CoA ligase